MSVKAATTNGTWTVEEETKLVSVIATFGTASWAKVAKMVPRRKYCECLLKWHRMSEQTAHAESVPKTDNTVLPQLSGLEVGPDLHDFPRDSQKCLALLGITTAQSLPESPSVRERKSRVGVDPTKPAGIHDDSFSGDADLSSGCNEAVLVDIGDEATPDGYTSGDEPPAKRRRFDWVSKYIPENLVVRVLEYRDSWR
jgi:hypothetical protein